MTIANNETGVCKAILPGITMVGLHGLHIIMMSLILFVC